MLILGLKGSVSHFWKGLKISQSCNDVYSKMYLRLCTLLKRIYIYVSINSKLFCIYKYKLFFTLTNFNIFSKSQKCL